MSKKIKIGSRGSKLALLYAQKLKRPSFKTQILMIKKLLLKQ